MWGQSDLDLWPPIVLQIEVNGPNLRKFPFPILIWHSKQHRVMWRWLFDLQPPNSNYFILETFPRDDLKISCSRKTLTFFVRPVWTYHWLLATEIQSVHPQFKIWKNSLKAFLRERTTIMVQQPQQQPKSTQQQWAKGPDPCWVPHTSWLRAL